MPRRAGLEREAWAGLQEEDQAWEGKVQGATVGPGQSLLVINPIQLWPVGPEDLLPSD